jgi:hypothetical protein
MEKIIPSDACVTNLYFCRAQIDCGLVVLLTLPRSRLLALMPSSPRKLQAISPRKVPGYDEEAATGMLSLPGSPSPKALKIVKAKKREDRSRCCGCHPLIIICGIIWMSVHITLVVWYWEGGTKLVDPDE